MQAEVGTYDKPRSEHRACTVFQFVLSGPVAGAEKYRRNAAVTQEIGLCCFQVSCVDANFQMYNNFKEHLAGICFCVVALGVGWHRMPVLQVSLLHCINRQTWDLLLLSIMSQAITDTYYTWGDNNRTPTLIQRNLAFQAGVQIRLDWRYQSFRDVPSGN